MNKLQKFIIKSFLGLPTEFQSEPDHKLPFLFNLGNLTKSQDGELTDNNIEYIKKGLSFNDVVYTVVNYLAETAASVPYCYYEKSSKGEVKKIENTDKRLLEIEALLEKPNPHETWEQFVSKELSIFLTCSESVIWKNSSLLEKGKIKSLHVLPPDSYTIFYDNEVLRIVKEVQFNDGKRIIPLKPEDVIIRFNPSYTAQSAGESPLKALRRTILNSNNLKNSANAYLENNGAMGFVTLQDEGVMPEDALALENTYIRKFTSPLNAGKVVFTNAKLDYIPTGNKITDMDSTNLHLANLRAIASAYKVPSQLVGDAAASTYSNYREARKALYTNAVLPQLKILFAKLSWELLPSFKGLERAYLVADTSQIFELQEDILTKMQSLKDAEFLTPNEKREILGYPKEENIPEMDMFFFRSGQTAIENLNLTAEG